MAIAGVDVGDPEHCSAIANLINEHFLSVAADLPCLQREYLPAFLPSPSPCPLIQPWETYQHLRSLNQRKAGITGDLPVRILREFAYEICFPLTNVLNASFQSFDVPFQWKLAEVVPIPKCQPPALDKLRPISLTSYFAKISETFICKWLLEDIEEHIDSNQYGNRPGLSTNHYLIKLLHQVLENAEHTRSTSTVVLSDFSKAFDRIDHNVLARKLIELHVRPFVIAWILNFLENRQQKVRYFGKSSDQGKVHAGVPQGTKLGPILFLIMINDACQDSVVPYYKYVDDLTLVESMVGNQPANMQHALNMFHNWSLQNNMTLNPSKCLAMNVSFSRNLVNPVPLSIGNRILNSVDKTKILGIIIQSNLKWDSHVSELVKRCNKKLYMLRCLKRYKLPLCDLITVYCGYIRPILDYGVPVFNGSLTVMNCCSLETIQKRACRIMLGDAYITYKIALEKCTLVTLKDRRKKICTDFASNLESNPQCQEWLPLTQSTHYSLRKRAKYQQFKCKTKRFQNSALPYLIRLLNEKDLNP